MTAQPKPFRVEITINADRDTVWQAMTSPEQIRQWFGWDYEGIDGEIRYIFVDHVELHPPERMLFEDGAYIELVADGPRTVVRAALPGSLDDADWDEIYDGIEEGWRTFLEQLRFLLETRPRGRRRTIYLTGTTTGAHALAIAGAGEQPWHTSRYQSMTIDSSGQLLGVASQAPLAGDGAGPTAITITTYGLDDDAFAAVRDEWADRWSAVPDAKVTTEMGEAAATGHAP
jgi:uncharacterized protein YndB with AHSA1/START domain